jgi:hypothetical protein
LCVSGIVAQWHEHLAQPLAALVHVAPYDRDPAAVPVLIAEPLEDPLSGVVLLGRVTLILRNGSSLGRAGGRLRRYPGGTENASIFATVRGSIPKRRAASR